MPYLWSYADFTFCKQGLAVESELSVKEGMDLLTSIPDNYQKLEPYYKQLDN